METTICKNPTPASKESKFPKNIFFIVGNEACERFSFYGMRSILTLYIVSVIYAGSNPEVANNEAVKIVHWFTMGVYFMPLLGAWIADKFFGRFWTIIFVSLIYCIGNFVLAATVGSEWGLFIGLALISIGSGGIKPCVSAFMGDQFDENQKHYLPRAFGMFYWAINFGSFFAFAIIPIIKDIHGYSWAFAVPGITMALATIIFALGSKFYKHVPSERVMKRQNDYVKLSFVEKFQSIKGIVLLFCIIPVFWALFDQMNSTWVLLSKSMVETKINLLALSDSYPVNAETIQSVNSIFVMILVPIFTMLIYPIFDKSKIFAATPLRRMTAGMIFAAMSFLICGYFQNLVDQGTMISIWWMALPYAILTIGEILFSTTGLEFAFSQAPASMKSIVTSFWNFTIVIGNGLVVISASFWNDLSLATRFYFFSGLMLVVAIVFGIASRFYKYKH